LALCEASLTPRRALGKTNAELVAGRAEGRKLRKQLLPRVWRGRQGLAGRSGKAIKAGPYRPVTEV